ncbi:nucleotide sugar dehydrogenase [Microvirga sp. VF16]|uniref:nucleotide sugar dehydrogenase n=1 Tax=Microvirga sp. VF16 TaxID=2807101 RepID=UPI00193CA568|nr:nucleotide sugar dehydrogenase [Microvirga sp. VF16]QRM27250.1 nucleotide sugar dehydrogenase [Microvirga sp. VF16]
MNTQSLIQDPELADLSADTNRSTIFAQDMKTVCVQGLGFVGAANAAAIASARNHSGQALYRVIGLDLDNEVGRKRASAINEGRVPFPTTDLSLVRAMMTANEIGNLFAVTDNSALSKADVIIVNVGVDVEKLGNVPSARLDPFRAALTVVGENMRPDALVLVETTVPPGTCERVVAPLLERCLELRGFRPDQLQLAYSYERVMPGGSYLASITDMWRVYAGFTFHAAERTEKFLSSYVDVARKPLFRLPNMRSAEMAKVLENTYRAVNIALIDEWERFARRIDVDLFAVLDSIRVRPTHSNIRFPGLGVGGYCLTKDPLFGPASARDIFGYDDLDFPISTLSVCINDAMPHVTAITLEERFGGELGGKRILVLGATYRADVGDTRLSPTITLVSALLERGAAVEVTDPLVDSFDEVEVPFYSDLPSAEKYDAVVIAVGHCQYRELDFSRWIGNSRPLLFDANGVLSREQMMTLSDAGLEVAAIGRGEL